MIEPPSVKTYIVPAGEMQELLKNPDVQSRLATCKIERQHVSQGNAWLDGQERKELVRHIDPLTNEEILLCAEYTCIDPNIVPPKPTTTIPLRLCTPDARYELKRL